MPSYYFEVTLDRDGYRGRFYSAGNRQLIWWTEGYRNRTDAEYAVRLMQTYAASAPLR